MCWSGHVETRSIVSESRRLSRRPNAGVVEVRLSGGGTFQASITAVTWGTPENAVTVECPRWQCPCGAWIDTEIAPAGLVEDVTGGLCITCSRCNRRYFVSCNSGKCFGISDVQGTDPPS